MEGRGRCACGWEMKTLRTKPRHACHADELEHTKVEVVEDLCDSEHELDASIVCASCSGTLTHWKSACSACGGFSAVRLLSEKKKKKLRVSVCNKCDFCAHHMSKEWKNHVCS